MNVSATAGVQRHTIGIRFFGDAAWTKFQVYLVFKAQGILPRLDTYCRHSRQTSLGVLCRGGFRADALHEPKADRGAPLIHRSGLLSYGSHLHSDCVGHTRGQTCKEPTRQARGIACTCISYCVCVCMTWGKTRDTFKCNFLTSQVLASPILASPFVCATRRADPQPPPPPPPFPRPPLEPSA